MLRPAWFISVCQRSEIESKSQLFLTCSPSDWGLYQYVKDQKLKANHNYTASIKSLLSVYISMSKIRNWKQITTILIDWRLIFMFISVCQRSEIESKSQPCVCNTGSGTGFISVCQRSEIESKSQLSPMVFINFICLYQYVKDQKLKANHNCLPL